MSAPMSTFVLLALLLAACAAPPRAQPAVRGWGTMREVLREGRGEGRVDLEAAALTGTTGLGVLAELAGEVTVLDGRVLVAVPDGPGGIAVRGALPGERAALLFLAQVERWEEILLPDCASYAGLEDAIAAVRSARGHDLATVLPVRVRGIAVGCALHVVAGACPIARPDGPPPRRWHGEHAPVELAGFHAGGAAGVLTHHGRRSHLHAVAAHAMGHLEEIHLRDAVLLVPADRR
jgi:hypothetical protein